MFGISFKKTEKDTTQCQLCKANLKFKGGSTSSMRNHLKFVHSKTNLQETNPLRQQSLKEMNKSKSELGSEKYGKLNIALACAVDLRPLSMVMGKGFRYFCHLLNPSYRVPCADTVKVYLLKLYVDQKKDLIELIGGNYDDTISFSR